MSTITRVCCVCKRVIGITEGYGVTGVSHGYCPQHLRDAGVAMGMEEEDEPDVETYDEAHDPEKCTDMRCEEPECVRAQRELQADRRYDEMRDREMEGKR